MCNASLTLILYSPFIAGPVISVYTVPADTSSASNTPNTSTDSEVVLTVVDGGGDFSAEEAQVCWLENNTLNSTVGNISCEQGSYTSMEKYGDKLINLQVLKCMGNKK